MPFHHSSRGKPAKWRGRLQNCPIAKPANKYPSAPSPSAFPVPWLTGWGFHSGWKLQQLQLQCSHTSPLHCPGDEDVPGPHPRTARHRDDPNAAASCQLAVATPCPSTTHEDDGTASQSGCNGARASRQQPGTDPSHKWLHRAERGSARRSHQFRLGLEGAGPVLGQAQLTISSSC